MATEKNRTTKRIKTLEDLDNRLGDVWYEAEQAGLSFDQIKNLFIEEVRYQRGQL